MSGSALVQHSGKAWCSLCTESEVGSARAQQTAAGMVCTTLSLMPPGQYEFTNRSDFERMGC